jgi:intein/homing endonuclease
MNTTEAFEKEVIELSKTKSQKEIALIYKMNIIKIRDILKNNGVKRKKSRLNMSHLALNIDYFKEINSPDKAYWLGYICADGGIKKSNNKVSLVSKDLEVIIGFKEAIGAGHTITKSTNYDHRTCKFYTGYSIQIGNELFVANLINLGVTSNKTDVLNFPNIEEKYYSYFIAGLFDGDGCVSMKGKYNHALTISLISTNEVLSFIKNYILLKFNIKSKYYCRVTENKSNVWRMILYADAFKFLNFIYSDNTFKYYLKRKYSVYLNNLDYMKRICRFRKVLQYDTNMKFIKTWDTIREVSVELLCPYTTLRWHLEHEDIYKNYIWKYEK